MRELRFTSSDRRYHRCRRKAANEEARAAAFALRGLERDPARRYPSVEAMLERLERRAEGRVPIQCSQTFFKRMLGELIRLVERRPTALPIAIALGVIVYAVLALLRSG